MTDAVQERYARFARDEAPGRSALYAAWAAGVAADEEVRGVLLRIPETRRQPPLVFAVTRILGAGLAAYPQWREFVLRNADEVGPIVDECIALGVKRLWLQDGVVNEEAARKARAAGITVVMDRCVWRDYLDFIP